jgi:2-methylisocitrate lyase-like PEP mutase family enzyme
MIQAEAFASFRDLHERPGAFVMPNAWDGASAVLLKRAGFEALGSSSLAIAFALGRQDCAHAVSCEDAVSNAALLARLTNLPVNGDLEDGFGPDPDDCARTVEAAIDGGLAGLGIEDTTADPDHPIHSFNMAVSRVRRAAEVARGRILLTARADNFLHGRPDLDDTIRRLVAFAEAGADVLYAPGLPDLGAIRAVARAVAPKPVNVVVGAATKGLDVAALGEAGVKRISLGGALYRRAMSELDAVAAEMRLGRLERALGAISSAELGALLPAPSPWT